MILVSSVDVTVVSVLLVLIHWIKRFAGENGVNEKRSDGWMDSVKWSERMR